MHASMQVRTCSQACMHIHAKIHDTHGGPQFNAHPRALLPTPPTNVLTVAHTPLVHTLAPIFVLRQGQQERRCASVWASMPASRERCCYGPGATFSCSHEGTFAPGPQPHMRHCRTQLYIGRCTPCIAAHNVPKRLALVLWRP